MPEICIVTATTNRERAKDCLASWGEVPVIVIENGKDSPYLGTVPAFNKGVQQALEQGYQIIACLHDDLEISDPDWAKKVLTHFRRHPECGLAGFGGAIGLGDADIYQKPYEPMQLARIGFRSNMTNAEAHGLRSLLPERVACLDGFSEIGRASFYAGECHLPAAMEPMPIWQQLEQADFRHHAYDSYLGVVAKRLGWETWYLPIACHHFGGRTAVGDAGYNEWAQQQIQGGDHGFWEQSHRQFYELGRDILPLRV